MAGRLVAFGSLLSVAAVLLVIVLAGRSGSRSHSSTPRVNHSAHSTKTHPAAQPAAATVPILSYNIINSPPPQSSVPTDRYVPADEFTAQMQALRAGGWRAVTLNQLESHWTSGTPLGSGKPIVITFDGGYASQYTNALPLLKQLGWAAVENLQVNGLPPSEGGLSDTQIRGLIAAGWELDTEGLSQSDLTVLGPGQLSSETSGARQTLHTRYGVPVNWFAYPSGRYGPTVEAAVRSAGFVGALTTVSAWASPQGDRFRLPRLRITGGTSPTTLLSQIQSAQANPAPPAASQGT